MALDQQFQRGVFTALTVPPERQAVRTLTPVVAGYARANTARAIDDLQSGTSRMAVNANLANAREDVRNARRDSGIAVPISVAGLGVDYLGAKERKAETEAEMKRREELNMYYDALGEIIARNYDDIIERLNPSGGF